MISENRCYVFLFSSIFIFSNFFVLHCFAAIFNITSSILLPQGEILISPADIAELGFFRLDNSANQYIGIWFKDAPRTIVWVANRENPITGSLASLKIGNDGNLKLLDGNNVTLWSTNVSVRSNCSVAVLSDNGNFVLQDVSGQKLWQSFENAGNTFLPGMGIGYDLETGKRRVLSSWKSDNDPSPGLFVAGLVPQTPPQAFIWKGSRPYWRSGQWNGIQFIGIPDMDQSYTTAFSLSLSNDQRTGYFYMNHNNYSAVTNMVISTRGSLKLRFWANHTGWDSHWRVPDNKCDIYGTCGPFGVCKISEASICSCPKGFVPKSGEEWNKGNWTGGCIRRTELHCLAGTSEKSPQGAKPDKFWKMEGMKLPDNANFFDVSNANECVQWCINNCSCKAYAYANGIGCLFWTKDLIDMQVFANSGEELFIRLAHSEFGQGKLRVDLIISFTIIALLVILGVLVYVIWPRRSNIIGIYKRTSKILDPDAQKDASPNSVLMYALRSILNEELQELPLYDFHSIAAATNNFSLANKLGQGGFGSVYKGKLHDGTDVAMKRLSSSSGQGIEEFKNEVMLISRLQHRNLVKLLGCCVEGEERILIYEFMANKSLDYFLFDPTKRAELSWSTRFSIIQRVARGLLYLHRDSCLRVIHRDLKASNVLLDDKMNPKISDFGLARMFEGTQYLENTHKVVGTLGYMSPEYAMGGMFSEKSDVFSFGVLVLEIVSGRKVNSCFYNDEHLSLISQAWNLWSQAEGLTFMDAALTDSFSATEVERCIQVALLCVQDHAENRPTMAAVVSMLSTEAELPQPKQPAFTFQSPSKPDRLQDSNSYNSIGEITTLADGR